MSTNKHEHHSSHFPTIEDLESFSNPELRQLFAQLNQSPPPQYASREFLSLNIAWMLQVIEMGDDPDEVRQDLLKQAWSFIRFHYPTI